MDMGRNIWLERARMVCWAGGEGFCLSDDFGVDSRGSGWGGVCGRIGTARPTSWWPRAFSTLGRLKRLNRDILEGVRSSWGAGEDVLVELDLVEAGCEEGSARLVVDRLKRHREVEGASWVRLRLLTGLSLDLSTEGMALAAAYSWPESSDMADAASPERCTMREVQITNWGQVGYLGPVLQSVEEVARAS